MHDKSLLSMRLYSQQHLATGLSVGLIQNLIYINVATAKLA